MKLALRFILVLTCILYGTVNQLQAATFGSYDPRSLAMGGTGVSHANIDHAAYFNPALLSVAQEDDDYSLLIPTIGIRAYDPDEVLDAVEAHQDGNYETALSDSIDTFNNAAPADKPALAQEVSDDAQRLLDSYEIMSGKSLDFEVHAGVGMAIPGKGLGMAVTASGRVMGGIVLNLSQADKDLLQKYIDLDPSVYDGSTFDPADLTSTATVRGASIIEGGLSLSHEFESLGNWSIGITPKTVRVDTYDYEVAVEESEIDEDTGKLSYDDTNIDIGVAKRISEGWKVGLVVKNVVKKEYKTVLGNTIVLEPTARLGISHHTNWTTLALDVDLTENDRTGLTGEKTQYVALGMEFELSLVQLRVGARHNMSAEADRESNMLSAGVGLYVVGFHVDAGVARNDDEVAAAVQLGFQF